MRQKPGLHRNRLHRKALTTGELLIAEGFQEREKGDHSGSDRYCSLPGFSLCRKRSYHSYKVLNTSEQEDVVSTQYVDMDGDILRYSPDGVSVVDNSMNTIWNETYTMQNPIADVNGSRAVVADSEGTSLYICDKKV